MEIRNKQYAELKEDLFYALTVTAFWGLLAHGYCFFEYSFSHDSLKELHGGVYGSDFKIALGRVFVPFYRALFRSEITLPWLIGILSLVWIGFAVFLTVRILNIRSKRMTFLTAGIFTANITVSAIAATYLHDLDCYMFSLLCAVAAVYCWKSGRRGIFPGTVLLTCSLGLYQGFLSVTVVLVMFVCICHLLEGKSLREVFSEGMVGIAMILAGGILYVFSIKTIQAFSGVELLSGTYNSMDRMQQIALREIPSLMVQTYRDWFERLFNAVNMYPDILVKCTLCLLMLICFAAFSVGLCNKRLGILEKLLCICLIALMPFGMHLIYVAMQWDTHDLMVFAIWMSYLFALWLCQWLVEWIEQKAWFTKYPIHRWGELVVTFLVVLVLYGNVQYANAMYLKKDLEKEAYISYMTRVLGQIESTEEYKAGETPVCLVGEPQNLINSPRGFDAYADVTGMHIGTLLGHGNRKRYEMLFDYLLGFPVVLADESTWDALQEHAEVVPMPSYPDTGSIRMIGDVLIVKLGD